MFCEGRGGSEGVEIEDINVVCGEGWWKRERRQEERSGGVDLLISWEHGVVEERGTGWILLFAWTLFACDCSEFW